LKRKKSGQMEIIGLVVIVILITLGMLFMAKFAIKDDSQKKIFTRKGLAYSTMSAIMKTSVIEPDCASGYTAGVKPQIGKDILEDCAKYYELPTYSIYSCKGAHSCEFLEEELKILFEETLNGWNKNYVFTSRLIKAQEDKPVPIIEAIKMGGGCPKSKARDCSGLFPIHTDAGLIENELCLCDKD
jgi:hypothetical protein